jgi:hypothetical protein
VIGGGYTNTIADRSSYCTIAGGRLNVVQTETTFGAIAGGSNNVVGPNSLCAAVPGGSRNKAAGDCSFAAGNRAKANHDGAFVWGDNTDADVASDRANQVKMRAGGGMYLLAQSTGLNPAAMRVESTSAAGVGLVVSQTSSDANIVIANPGTGPQIKAFNGPGGGTLVFQVDNDGDVICKSLVQTSDRNAKENVTPIDPRAVLDKVAAMPISQWSFRQDHSRHLGPMAQDFHAAFGLGESDKGITSVDADGVALAAIQGLNQKLESGNAALRRELRNRETEVEDLRRRLEALERRINASYPLMNRGTGQ